MKCKFVKLQFANGRTEGRTVGILAVVSTAEPQRMLHIFIPYRYLLPQPNLASFSCLAPNKLEANMQIIDSHVVVVDNWRVFIIHPPASSLLARQCNILHLGRIYSSNLWLTPWTYK